jgi:hypothetical protein
MLTQLKRKKAAVFFNASSNYSNRLKENLPQLSMEMGDKWWGI